MLTVQRLNAGYGRLQVLFDVDFEAVDGDITVIVGPNGSGKSTLLKSVFGLTSIYSGHVQYNGHALTRGRPHEVAGHGIAYLPQTDNIFANLSVRENLLMAGYIVDNLERAQRVEEVLHLFPILPEFIDRKAGTLSGGERQMLAMAMALIRSPTILMFDEPTANLAPKIALEVLRKIVDLREQVKLTIILVEQNARKALEIGHHAYLLVGGRIAFQGAANDLLNHRELSQLYLGVKTATQAGG